MIPLSALENTTLFVYYTAGQPAFSRACGRCTERKKKLTGSLFCDHMIVPVKTTVSQNGTTATVAATDIEKNRRISFGEATLLTRDIVRWLCRGVRHTNTRNDCNPKRRRKGEVGGGGGVARQAARSVNNGTKMVICSSEGGLIMARRWATPKRRNLPNETHHHQSPEKFHCPIFPQSHVISSFSTASAG